jgi:6-phosphogluconolactonase
MIQFLQCRDFSGKLLKKFCQTTIVVVSFLIISCEPPNYPSPCSPKSKFFQYTVIFQSATNNKSEFCGFKANVGTPSGTVHRNFTLGGTITGLTNAGLVLSSGTVSDQNLMLASGSTTFQFPTSILSGSAYNLTVKTVPENRMNCSLTNGSGTITGNVTNIAINCTLKQAKFVLAANGANTIAVYSMNPANGVLNQVAGSPFSSGTLNSPRFIATHPSGSFVYAANGAGSSVAGFSINSTTGALTSLGAAFTAPQNPYALVLNAAGTFLYVASNASKEVFLYSVNQTTGALTYIQAFLATTSGGAGIVGALFIDSTGKFMYTGLTSTPGITDVFAIDQTTGFLTLQGSPGPYSTFGNNNIAVTVDPFSRFVYAGYYSSNQVSAFTMNTSTGALTQIAGSPFITSGAAGTFITVEATGKFVYVANSGSANISGFAINSSTGGLTTIAGSPFTGTASPSVVYTDPTSSFLYCANTSNPGTVSGFTINATTGALTQIGGSPWTTSGNGTFGLAFVSY